MTDTNPHEEFEDELLSAYVDGELTDDERATLEQRLRDDPGAREMVAELSAVSRTLRSVPKHALGADLREVVLRQAVVHAKPAPVEIGGTRRWAWAAMALAAALLLAVYLPDAERDEQPLAQAVSKNRAAESLSSPVVAGVLGAGDELRKEIERTADADRLALSNSFDGTLKRAAIPSPYLQPIGEVRAEDYHIHLTPVDGNVGAARFDRLLANHGIVVRGNSPAHAADDKPGANGTELVIVEAPLEQIQQVVASCGGGDSPWKSLRLVDQQGYDVSLASFARQKPLAGSPAGESVEVALDSLSLQGGDAHVRGWAMHLGQSRITAGKSNHTESASSGGKPAATLRVLFVLHPAAE